MANCLSDESKFLYVLARGNYQRSFALDCTVVGRETWIRRFPGGHIPEDRKKLEFSSCVQKTTADFLSEELRFSCPGDSSKFSPK